jgi:hypothetical protein
LTHPPHRAAAERDEVGEMKGGSEKEISGDDGERCYNLSHGLANAHCASEGGFSFHFPYQLFIQRIRNDDVSWHFSAKPHIGIRMNNSYTT